MQAAVKRRNVTSKEKEDYCFKDTARLLYGLLTRLFAVSKAVKVFRRPKTTDSGHRTCTSANRDPCVKLFVDGKSMHKFGGRYRYLP